MSLEWDNQGGFFSSVEETGQNIDKKGVMVLRITLEPGGLSGDDAIATVYAGEDKSSVDGETSGEIAKRTAFGGTNITQAVFTIPLQPSWYYRIADESGGDGDISLGAAPNSVWYTLRDFDVSEGHDHRGIHSKLIEDVHPDEELRKRYAIAESARSERLFREREAAIIERGYGNRTAMERRARELLDERKQAQNVVTITAEFTGDPTIGDHVTLEDHDVTFEVRDVTHLGENRYKLKLAEPLRRVADYQVKQRDKMSLLERYGGG